MPAGYGYAPLTQALGSYDPNAAVMPPAPTQPFRGYNPAQNRLNRRLSFSLEQLLASGGHTDPGALNLELTGIGRSTEASQLGLRDYLAQNNLGGSGLGAALQAAIGQSGGEQMQAARARENAAAEERRRQDIALVMQQLESVRQAHLARRQMQNERKVAKANLRQRRKELAASIISQIVSSGAGGAAVGGK